MRHPDPSAGLDALIMPAQWCEERGVPPGASHFSSIFQLLDRVTQGKVAVRTEEMGAGSMRGRILEVAPGPVDDAIGRAGEYLISETEDRSSYRQLPRTSLAAPSL